MAVVHNVEAERCWMLFIVAFHPSPFVVEEWFVLFLDREYQRFALPGVSDGTIERERHQAYRALERPLTLGTGSISKCASLVTQDVLHRPLSWLDNGSSAKQILEHSRSCI